MNVGIIDAHNHAYRFFHGRKRKVPDGAPGYETNAVEGWIEMLMDLRQQFALDEVFAVFDPLEKEEVADDDYKGNREPVPAALEPQLSDIMDLAGMLGVRVVTGVNNEEGDQLAASLVYRLPFHQVFMFTIDKDFAQLVGDGVHWVRPQGSRWHIMNRVQVHEKFGVWPEQMADYLLLVGDASDNLPGVPGIGPKNATMLLQQERSLKNALRSGAPCLSDRLRNNLLEDRDNITARRELIELTPCYVTIPEPRWEIDRACKRLKSLGLHSLAYQLKPKAKGWLTNWTNKAA